MEVEMTGLIKTGNLAHDQALAVAEGTRQSAAAAAAQSPAGQLAVNASEIAWARACVQSCITNNGGGRGPGLLALLGNLWAGGDFNCRAQAHFTHDAGTH